MIPSKDELKEIREQWVDLKEDKIPTDGNSPINFARLVTLIDLVNYIPKLLEYIEELEKFKKRVLYEFAGEVLRSPSPSEKEEKPNE